LQIPEAKNQESSSNPEEDPKRLTGASSELDRATAIIEETDVISAAECDLRADTSHSDKLATEINDGN